MSTRRTVTVVLANVGETFAAYRGVPPEPPSKASGLWQKATLWPDQPGYVLVAPETPSNLSPVRGAWHQPNDVIVPKRRTGLICLDLLGDQSAWHRLVSACREGAFTRFMPQVFSPAVAEVAAALQAESIMVRSDEMPQVSGSTVRYWNTKIGGHDVLGTVAELRAALPAAVICNTLAEAITFVSSTEAKQGLVVKANTSMGGTGVWLFPPELRRELETVAARFRAPIAGVKDSISKGLGDITGPYVVEELIGLPEENCSPTADFRIDCAGIEHLRGIALQRLASGVQYLGAMSGSAELDGALDRCVALGRAACAMLSRRGYRGPVNIDFVVAKHRLAIVELNLRQSAPLDQFLVLRRISDSMPTTLDPVFPDDTSSQPQHWSLTSRAQPIGAVDTPTSRLAWLSDESVPLGTPGATVEEIANLLTAALPATDSPHVYPLFVGGCTVDDSRVVSILSVGDTSHEAEIRMIMARSALQFGTLRMSRED